MRIEEVAEKTCRLEIRIEGSGIIFSVYLIQAGGGVVIEPGPTAVVPAILEGMKEAGMSEISLIIPTHIHMDHAGGTGRLAQLFPNARVLSHPESAPHFVDPVRLIRGTRQTYGEDFELCYGAVLPVPWLQVKMVSDGEIVDTGERELCIYHAPGHAPHHIAILDGKTGALFCGEALGMPTDDPLPAAAAPGFDLDASVETMEKLGMLKPSMLLYSHGGVGLSPQWRISRAMESTRNYGEMILQSIKNGEGREEISRKVLEWSSARFPPNWDGDMIRVWLTGMVEGYTIFFRNRGMA
ncbi:MAG: MBL fold metallo-hydrolase [Dehalococcoidia bacterium]